MNYVPQLENEPEVDDLPVPEGADTLQQRNRTTAEGNAVPNSENLNGISFIDQHSLLRQYIHKNVVQIQKNMIDLNTFLFSDLMLTVDKSHRQFVLTESYLNEWNTMMANANQFVRAVVALFEKQLQINPELAFAHRGEYNYLVDDFKVFIDMDKVMQSIMFSPDLIGTQEPVEHPLEELLRRYRNTLDEIYDRIIECCPTPTSYLQKLPSNARTIANYEKIFRYWDKSKRDAHGMLRYMGIDSSSAEDGKKISDLINNLESIQILWQEKKRKLPSKSPKLRKLQDILHSLRLSHPNKISRLTLARKTNKEDFANMLRIWYTELLIGRVSLLTKKLLEQNVIQVAEGQFVLLDEVFEYPGNDFEDDEQMDEHE